ncbi:MAG: SurA N-terminal domain-containing protein [Hyphomicrobiaceae bacterium]
MLDALRKSTTGFLAKALIALLVLSFAVWGVADVVTGVGRSVVASIGDTEISAIEFQREYQQQLDGMSRQFGRRLTPTQARTFGLENRVLSSMLGARAVDNHAKNLNLSITDAVVEESVRKDPVFQGSNGQFSPDRLDQVLQSMGYTEQYFLSSRRADTVREQLTGALLENVTVPDTLLNVYRTFRDEERVVRYFTLDPAKTISLPAPSDADLKKTYEGNKSRFMSAETRHIEILMITADDAKKKIKISDDELQKDYVTSKDRYSVPEKRKVLQLPLKDKDTAQKALDEIKGGKTFAEVAKSNGAKESDIDLGIVTKSQMIDPTIADAAFALQKDKVSDIVEGRFSTVLLLVTEVQPGNVPTFAEVKDKIFDRLAGQRAGSEIRRLQDLVDDNRLAGKSLEVIAKAIDITYKNIASADNKGNGPDGKPTFESADLQKIVGTAFGSSAGVENEVIELTDGGYAWVRVLKVTKAEQKPFESVKADAETAWRESETRKALRKKAEAYTAQLKGGAKFEEIAQTAGGEVKTTPAFKRSTSLPDLTAAAVRRAFSLKKDTPASAATTDGKSRLIFEVTEIKAPQNLKDDEKEKVVNELVGQLRTDTVQEYVIALRKRMGVEINQALIDQTIGITPRGY